jgi:urease accessory protein UreE
MVYRIPFESAGHAALVAWKAGNLHLPVEIGDEAILVLHDEAMAVLLEREGWDYSEPEVLFRPLKAVAHNP